MFYTEYEPTQPRVHLVLNGGGALDEWNWENIPEHWLKRGMVSHGYQLNNERETEEKYMEQVMLIWSSIERAMLICSSAMCTCRPEETWMDTRSDFEERMLRTQQKTVGVNL